MFSGPSLNTRGQSGGAARWRGLAAGSDGAVLRTAGDLPFNNEGFQHLELKKKQFSLQSPPRTPHQRGGGGSDGGGGFLAADCQVREKAAVFVRGLGRQQLLVIAGYFWQFDVSSVLLGHRRSLGRGGGGPGGCCDMHFKWLHIQLVSGSDLPFDPFSAASPFWESNIRVG